MRTNSIRYDVLEVLKQKKVEASVKASENWCKAKTALPEIVELDNLRKQLHMKAAWAVFEGSDAIAIREERAQTEEIENKLLAQVGMSLADFEPKAECQKCGDSGFVDGKMCTCAKRIASKILLEESGFNRPLPKFEQSNFALFRDRAERASEIYAKMQAWCNRPESPLRIILFLGPTGTGKTHLTECMADSLIEQGTEVVFTTAFNYIQAAREYQYSFDENRDYILNKYLKADVLFVDDLGTEPMLKNITEENIYTLINERVANNLRTVFTTNLTLAQIEERYGPRVLSRLANKQTGAVISMHGEDLRQIKKGSAK